MSDQTQEKLIEAVKIALGKVKKEIYLNLQQVTLVVPCDDVVQTLKCLKEHEDTQFHQLMDVCGVDYLDRGPRFDIAYQLLSLSHNWRLTVLVGVNETHPVPSVTSVYPSAGWFEREVFDLFGIKFSGHPDLRRILTDYDFDGYPLRKDFPLIGRTQVRYDDLNCKVVREPVDLETPLRDYDAVSPWQGVTDVQKRGGGA